MTEVVLTLENVPHVAEAHVTANLTPAPLVSFSAFATNLADALTPNEVSALLKSTVMGRPTIGRVTLLFAEGLLVTDAVSVTEVFKGIVAGAV